MSQEVQVLVQRNDGSFACGLGVPTQISVAGGALSGMSRLVYLVEAHIQDLMTALNPTPGVNAVQTITVSANTTGGQFTLAFNGSAPSTPIQFNDSAAVMQAALTALPTIGPYNVQVTLANNIYTVTFQGTLGQAPQPLLVAAGTLVPGSATVTPASQVTGAPSPSPVKISSLVDGNGELSVAISDGTGASWTYRVIPAIELGTTKFAFLGRLTGGIPNVMLPLQGIYPGTEYEWREATVRYQAPVGAPEPTHLYGMQITTAEEQ